jgi:predicted Rossmann fold flavoprotein
MLITHKGFSGPLIIDNSRYMKKGCQLEINFTGFDSSETFNEQFIKHSERNGKILLKNFLGKFDLPRRLVEKLLKQNCIDENTRLSQLNKIVRKQIVRSFTAYPVKVKKIGGINESMITVGGIDLDDVNLSTMESKSIRGLYFCGEVLDIDGDTGGYNIQLAISTGFIAGNAQ